MKTSRYKASDQPLVILMKEAEVLMNEVKVEYELYFLQQRRSAPEHKAKQLQRRVRELDRHFTTNTQLKFKRNALRSRHGSLRTYWSRIMLQIEAGTYRRHREVADRHDAARQAHDIELAQQRAAEKQGAPSDAVGEPAAPSRPDAARPKRIRLPRGVYSEGSSSLFKAYTAAREKTGEGSQGLDEKKLRMALRQHAKAVKARTGAKHVAFRVDVEDGKTRLKVIPIRE